MTKLRAYKISYISAVALFGVLVFGWWGEAFAFDPAKDNITCVGSANTCWNNQLKTTDTFVSYWDPHTQGLLCGVDFTFYRTGSPSDDILINLYVTGYPSGSLDNINDLTSLITTYVVDPMTFHVGGVSNGTNLGLTATHLDLSAYLCATVDDKMVFTFKRTGAQDNSNYATLVSYNSGAEVGNWTAWFADTRPADNDGQFHPINFPPVVNITNNLGQIDPIKYEGYFQKPATSSFDDTNPGFFQWLFTPSKQSLDQFGNLLGLVSAKPPFGYFAIIKSDFDNMAVASGSVHVDISGFESIFNPLITGTAVMLWFGFGVYIVKRFIHFEF